MRASVLHGLLPAAAIVLLATGCPMIDSTLTLDHVAVMKPIAGHEIKVFLAGVSDGRQDKRRIGCKKTGTGSESADLFLDVPLAAWFGGVLNEEMRLAGLKLAGADDASAVRLEVVLQHFFIEPDAGFWGFDNYALVSAEVVVRFPGGESFARRIAAKERTGSMMATDGSYIEAMRQAMESWILQAVTSIVKLIESRAQPGQAAGDGWRRWS